MKHQNRIAGSANEDVLAWVRQHNANRDSRRSRMQPLVENGPEHVVRDMKKEEKTMFGLKRIVVADNQRAFVWRDGRFQKLLGPGVYRVWTRFGRVSVELLPVDSNAVNHAKLDFVLQLAPELAESAFHVVSVAESAVALVYLGTRLLTVLGSASRAVYWRAMPDFRVEMLDISEDFRVKPAVASQLLKNGSQMLWAEVPAEHVGLLYVDGKLAEQLAPGNYGYWKFGRSLRVDLVDLRVQALEVSGQEMLTADKISLRVNLTASFQVVDAVKAHTELQRYQDFLYRELQFGLRQAVGNRTLDELLTGKDGLNERVYDYVRERAAAYGLDVQNVGVKDVILPGDMKSILNQVVEAEKQAQANVIRRREEANATRSLLNTAKLMDENPTLLRLKELESLEKVTDRIGQLTVFGGLDGVMKELVSLKG